MSSPGAADAKFYEVAREVLDALDTATLATASTQGAPRAVTVGAELKDGVFDWRSWPSRYHSRHVEENPQIAFDFFNQATRQSVYGTAVVVSTETDEGDFIRYRAKVAELWVVVDERVDGEYCPPQQLDPHKI